MTPPTNFIKQERKRKYDIVKFELEYHENAPTTKNCCVKKILPPKSNINNCDIKIYRTKKLNPWGHLVEEGAGPEFLESC